MLLKYILLGCVMLYAVQTFAQNEARDKLNFTGDFRFRVEHDWDSRKPDGTYRDDRSRLRYRLRFGFTYQATKHYSFGARIRTGRLDDQQGPHTTLGSEFSTLQLGFEKLYFQAQKGIIKGWAGKNTFPFYKTNELFWNDNVFPDGIAVMCNIPVSSVADKLQLNAGHFVVSSNGKGFDEDSYFQGIQLVSKHFDERLTLFPSFYYFNQLADIPDGQGSFTMDYAIMHLGLNFQVASKPHVSIGFDYYQNFEKLSEHDEITSDMSNQHRAEVVNIKIGKLNAKGQWSTSIYLAHIEKYAIVDYFAQNDWARWDYSSTGAAGSRLSNFQGIEVRTGYALADNTNLILRIYSVEQLVTESPEKENGNRVRIDLNVKF